MWTAEEDYAGQKGGGEGMRKSDKSSIAATAGGCCRCVEGAAGVCCQWRNMGVYIDCVTLLRCVMFDCVYNHLL